MAFQNLIRPLTAATAATTTIPSLLLKVLLVAGGLGGRWGYQLGQGHGYAGMAEAAAVDVALEASFSAAPYLLELLETAAQENSSSYFPLLDRIADGHFADANTEKDLYDSFLAVLEEDGHLSSAESLSTFQLALTLHAAAPRVQAHYQYYNTTISPALPKAQDASCPIWIHRDGRQYCSPGLERAQQDYGGPNDHDLPFDRSIRSGAADISVSTLYADISSPLFGQFHQALSEAARNGETVYRLRYRPAAQEDQRPLRVSGYGVELQLKRTDYIVIDDREETQSQTTTKKKENTAAGREVEDTSDLRPLSASELLSLGMRTSSHVLASKDPLDTLLKVSQDFPKYSHSLSQESISSEFAAEHEANRQLLLPEGYNVLWMNGLQIAWRQMDAYALLDRLRQERNFVHSLQSAGLSAPEAISLISHSAITDSRTTDDVARYDWRDTIEGGKVIMWLNDIEKDSRYADWPVQSAALLKRMYPGQMPNVRRDIHNLVIPADLSNPLDLDNVVEVLYNLVRRQIPVRFGFVPTGSSAAAKQLARIVYYLRDTYGIGAALSFLQKTVELEKPSDVKEKTFLAATENKSQRKGKELLSFDEVIAGPQTEEYLTKSGEYLARLGAAGPNPPGFVNGVPVAINEQWLGVMSNRVSIDLQSLQQKVYLEGIDDDVWLAGEFLADAATNRNPLVIPEDEDEIELVSLSQILKDHEGVWRELDTKPAASTENITQWNHVLVVVDQETGEGQRLIETIESFKNSPRANGAEITVISSTASEERSTALAASLGFHIGQSGLIVNGRRVGPISQDTVFTVLDMEALLDYERQRRLGPVVEALANLTLTARITSPRDLASISALVAKSALPDVPQGVYDNNGAVRMDSFKEWQDEHTAFTIGNNKTATVQIVGAIDPTSELAQRWIPIIKVLSQLDGVYVKLFLNPRQALKELPIKRFYRYVLQNKPHFSETGTLAPSSAHFEGIPTEALLNLGLDVPPAWLVSAKESIYDLDNLKLSTVKGDVEAVYELEYILIEGHSKDRTTGEAPRGAQLLLGTESDPQAADTLVMANLGYFQFKANPGYWNIQLKAGRSANILNIDTIGDTDDDEDEESADTHVALLSWQGKTLFPRFSRRPGKEQEDVLAMPQADDEGGFLSKAKSMGQSILKKTGVAPARKHADINIFSVASGHLYERMLNIMMASVMKNTKHTVKFWFLEQFLSPSFKATIPYLSETYGFEYELVSYKWPHWLRPQKEKQREIWGYKILFLDVLFPLDLDKVIFVDSDQIIRTDMYDLVTHDLEGAPYGFTPMCDSRTEMEGFRFWKQGYWKNSLQGLPYHISALYVVDLKRFRAMAAGDRLRGQYHQLSADPNSLSNLDQDLPNNMQAQLPIHSLPQEWLWCETWCSDESLKEARTIDLCNNPLTKEPKLDRARRQIPEWTEYDDEIAALLRQVRGAADGDGAAGADQVGQQGGSVQEEMDQQAKKDFDDEQQRKEQKEKPESKDKDEL